ncbi:hypothetical protein C8J56DRAFT_1054994 [Mycena floridula]|nr:hypothetical protein C8J56DRAFT_1054994 [Mycena floridula]
MNHTTSQPSPASPWLDFITDDSIPSSFKLGYPSDIEIHHISPNFTIRMSNRALCNQSGHFVVEFVEPNPDGSYKRVPPPSGVKVISTVGRSTSTMFHTVLASNLFIVQLCERVIFQIKDEFIDWVPPKWDYDFGDVDMALGSHDLTANPWSWRLSFSPLLASSDIRVPAESLTLYYRENSEEKTARVINLSNASATELEALSQACQPASFGRGNEDVLDESYRKAGRLDATQFSGSAFPLSFPGKGSFFKAHKDTPLTSPSIAYIAFYSDIEHEVTPVTSGYRISLTYNLYMEPAIGPLDENETEDKAITSIYHPLKSMLQELISDYIPS